MKVLFVCMGNICRSPTAQGVFERLLEKRDRSLVTAVDSAGTHAYHCGEPPDPRSQAAAHRRGYDLSAQRARQVVDQDFTQFDLIIAMDEDNLLTLKNRCPSACQDRLHLMLSFASTEQATTTRSVPDPYYGGTDGFDLVVSMLESACEGLLDHIEDPTGAHTKR